MRRVSRRARQTAELVLLALLGLLGSDCDAKAKEAAPATRAPTPPATAASPATAQPPAAAAAGASKEAPLIAVEAFDCFVLEDAAATAEPPSGPGIGAWSGGGPGGASWNASRLLCAATVGTTCADGQVTAELRIGKALVASSRAPIRDGKVQWRAAVKAKQWEKNFDELAAARPVPPYRTALFRLTASLTCRAPYQLAPGIGPRAEFAAERMFVAGFARGE